MMEFANGPFNEDVYLCEEFLRLKDKYGVTHVIETGTHLGETTEWLCKNFARVQTIEINSDYLRRSMPRLADYLNCNVYQGDSRQLLTPMLWLAPPKDSKLLVFLDAHWYANPVLDELHQIAESGKKPIIVIHDFFNPNHPEYGFDEYPDQGIKYTWEWIKPSIEAIYGDSFEYYYNNKATGAKRGCIFIIPK